MDMYLSAVYSPEIIPKDTTANSMPQTNWFQEVVPRTPAGAATVVLSDCAVSIVFIETQGGVRRMDVRKFLMM